VKNSKSIEQKLNENNIKIKNLRINRNIKFTDALFHTANIATSQIVSYNCICSAFEGNQWLYIPFIPLCFLFAFNCKKLSEKLGEITFDNKELKELKQMKKQLELYNNVNKAQNFQKKKVLGKNIKNEF